MRFVPRGLSDAFDSTEKFMGACLSLANLVFDQGNPEIVVARPGAASFATFSGFTAPDTVSVQVTIGTRVYGMIASGLNSGKDQPFCYDTATSAYVAISGIINANSPTTQATTGEWTPPTMAVVGTNLIVTHPGFSSTAFKFGVIDISVPATPAWSGTDTTGNALSAIPTAVANFFNRAYFAVNYFLEYTDVLTLNRTAGTQVLTIGGPVNISALNGLPIQTTSSGIIQSLTVFKPFEVWQVTGDAAISTNPLSVNFLSLTVGTSSPRSVALSPLGLYFAGVDGPYIIDQLGSIKYVTFSGKESEPDIHVPFQNVVVPSRMAGCYSGGVYRVCMETIVRGTQGKNDYWFDERKRRWTGPHSFSYDCAARLGNYFVLVSNDDVAKLLKSQAHPDTTTVFQDDGSAVVSTLLTATMPKKGDMFEHQVIESTVELSGAGQATTYSITALNEQMDTLNACSILVSPAGAVWGSFVWGDGTKYSSATNIPRVYNIPWTGPIVFQKMSMQIQATATAGLSIGSSFSRYANTGYTNQMNPS